VENSLGVRHGSFGNSETQHGSLSRHALSNGSLTEVKLLTSGSNFDKGNFGQLESLGTRGSLGTRSGLGTRGSLGTRSSLGNSEHFGNNQNQRVLHPILLRYPSIRVADSSKFIKHFLHKPRIDYNVRPVVQAQRRIPLALLEKVEAEIRRMHESDVLEPIDSSRWVSNMVVVPKANGDVRICCDLSDLNKAVIYDRYPLPTIDELSKFFSGATVFSKVDLKWGYLQVLLHSFVCHLTAIITPLGLF